MRVFLAGAAGAIGRQLVPMLIDAGHEIHGTTRSPERAAWLRSAGAVPVILDAQDQAALRDAVILAQPDAIIHELTDLKAGLRDDDLSATARLRQSSIQAVADALLATGGGRLIAQSAGWLYAPGPLPHRESDPLLDPAANPAQRTLPGILAVERVTLATARIEGTVLRYGLLYGPGTVSAEREDRPAVHVAAAARATALALVSEARGIFNVVDDGEDVSNERARTVLGWNPGVRA
jgi:nucleoside-diphosphate-sugar epimerase